MSRRSSRRVFASLLSSSFVVASGAIAGCESIPGTPTEASALCAEIARTVCEADARCFGATSMRAACQTAQVEACEESVGALAIDARLAYDPARAGAFLVSLDRSAQSCWDTPVDVDAFLDVFAGTGEDGADCTPASMTGHELLVSSLSCADGTACRIHLRIDGSPEGVCEARNDAACSHPWDCDGGEYCSLPDRWQPGVWGECRPRRADGWACESGLECASLHCDGTCSAAPDDQLALEVDYDALVRTSGPELYLRLNESSGARRDEMGGASAAATGGTVTRVAMGAISGDGAAGLAEGSFLRLPAPEALEESGALSFECWVRPTDVMSVQPILEIADAMDYGPHVWAFDSGDKIYASFRDEELEGHTVMSAEAALVAEEWHHVVATWDGMRGVLYLDGRRIGDTAVTGPLRVTGDLLIGHRNAYGEAEARGFTGAIDEVAVYARALEADEITRHHAAAAGPIENEFALFAWTR
jgi:hypothetical protein